MTKVLPTRALGLLLMIGFIDLLATAFLHAQGRIVELNPVMRPIIERSEWLFAVVKGGTLLLAWLAMAAYARHNLAFVRKASIYGSLAYVTVWCAWFFSSL